MASEYSSVGKMSDVRAIETLRLGKGRSAFEQRLYNRGDDARDQYFYRYPLELMSDPAHQNAMLIEIFDTNPTALETKRNVFQGVTDQISSSVFGAQSTAEGGGEGIDFAGIANAGFQAASAGLGQLASSAMSGFLGGDLGGLGLGRDSYTEEQTGVAGGTTLAPHRIYLYMPTGIEVGYGFEYETSNMSALDILKLPKALAEGNAAAASELARKVAMVNLKVLDKVGEVAGAEQGTFGKLVSAQQRQVINPMALHIFKEVKRREFTFSYTFLPKNRKELMNCHGIINILKYYAHPKRSEGSGRFLDYPAEFAIHFLHGEGRTNMYMPYIFKCALAGIKVNYGEETVFSTFSSIDDPMGASPTKMRVELSFQELEILTRERFGIDFSSAPSA